MSYTALFSLPNGPYKVFEYEGSRCLDWIAVEWAKDVIKRTGIRYPYVMVEQPFGGNIPYFGMQSWCYSIPITFSDDEKPRQ